MNYWNYFENTEEMDGVIPNGTIAKVRLRIKLGGYNDESQNWTGGYATRSKSGAVYLNSEFTVLEGEYAKRTVWGLIGLHSPKGPEWMNISRHFIKSIVNSARGISGKDNSEAAIIARRINSFEDLDGIEFVARIDEVIDSNGNRKNEIKTAVTSDCKEYGGIAKKSEPEIQQSINRPNWA
jgi:hypothetical protein